MLYKTTITQMRFLVTYNGKEVGRYDTYHEANAFAWAYGNGTFETIEIIDTNSGLLLTKIAGNPRQ